MHKPHSWLSTLVLTEIPDDEKVFQCKIVCMLQLGKYEDILITIKKNPKFVRWEGKKLFSYIIIQLSGPNYL